MILEQIFERFVEDELGNGRSLRATLQDAFLVALRVRGDPFSLDDPWSSVEIHGKLQMKCRVLELLGRWDDVVHGDRVVEA